MKLNKLFCKSYLDSFPSQARKEDHTDDFATVRASNAAFGPAVFANHAYYGIVHRAYDLLNFPAVRLPIIREVAVLMAHYSQVRPVRIDRDLSGPAGPPGVKMATSWWARLTRWPGVKHPKARGRAGTIALPLRESLARRAGVPACLPACLSAWPGLVG